MGLMVQRVRTRRAVRWHSHGIPRTATARSRLPAKTRTSPPQGEMDQANILLPCRFATPIAPALPTAPASTSAMPRPRSGRSPARRLVELNAIVSVSGSLQRPGRLNPHTAAWDWGDGTTSPGAVSEAGGRAA